MFDRAVAASSAGRGADGTAVDGSGDPEAAEPDGEAPDGASVAGVVSVDGCAEVMLSALGAGLPDADALGVGLPAGAGADAVGGGAVGSAAAERAVPDRASMTTSVVSGACQTLLLNAVPPEVHECWRDAISLR